MRGPFVIITLAQVERLLELEPACWPLFVILLFENFRTRGEPFAPPIGELCSLKGLSRTTLWRAMRQLETGGLISIQRSPPQPPLITVSTEVTVSPVKQ